MKLKILKSKKELQQASTLIWHSFTMYGKEEYEQPAIQAFQRFLDSGQLVLQVKAKKLIFYGLFVEKSLVAVAAMRKEHLSLLFVSHETIRQGYGRTLLQSLIKIQEKTSHQMTVQAAPSAVGFYQRLGFRATGPKTVVNGSPYTPMTLYFKEKDGEL